MNTHNVSIENSPRSRMSYVNESSSDKNKKSAFDSSIELFTTPTFSINKFFPENKPLEFNRAATLDGKYREQYMMRGKQDYLTKTLGYENSAPSTPRIISNIKIENFSDTVMEIVTPRRVSIEKVADVSQPVVFYRSSSVDLSKNSSDLRSFIENDINSRRLSQRSLSEVPIGAKDLSILKQKNSPIITSPSTTPGTRRQKNVTDAMSFESNENKRRIDNKVLSPPPRLEKIPETDILMNNNVKNTFNQLVLGQAATEISNSNLIQSNQQEKSALLPEMASPYIENQLKVEGKATTSIIPNSNFDIADSLACKIDGVKKDLDSEVFGKFPEGASSFFNKIDPTILAKAIQVEEQNRSANQSLSSTPRGSQTARLSENGKGYTTI